MAHAEDNLTTIAAPAVPARAAVANPARRLRRFRRWMRALVADDGTSARFATERQRDEGLVRRVESRRRP